MINRGMLLHPNGSRLGEVGDFENKTLKLLLNLNRITNVQ